MLLPIRSQGFPNLIDELGVQSPMVGPFWNFESTVLPVVDVRGLRNKARSGVVYDGFASAGQIPTPAANSFLAQTNNQFFAGAWAIRVSFAWVNTTAANAFIAFRRFNDTFTVVLEEEIVAVVGQPATNEGEIGYGFKDYVLQKNSFGQPWAVQNLQALATAGTVLWASLRLRYLGEVEGPAGF